MRIGFVYTDVDVLYLNLRPDRRLAASPAAPASHSRVSGNEAAQLRDQKYHRDTNSGVPRISFFAGINSTQILYLPGWELVALAVLSL